MAKHNDFGKEAEIIAQKFLLEKKYSILETNWRFNKYEIDIIALEKNTLVIVEVKARINPMISPEEAVNKAKQKFLIYATNKYIEQNNIDYEIRFDIISITKTKYWDIKHIKNAFNALID